MNVYLMVGVPGSGKSHWIKQHAPGAVVCSADHYFTGEDGVYRWFPDGLYPAHERCFEKYRNALLEGMHDVVVDNTNTKTKFMRRYVQLANEHVITPVVVYVKCDPVVAAARNTHGVPVDTVQKMHDEIEAMFSRPFPPYDGWGKVTL